MHLQLKTAHAARGSILLDFNCLYFKNSTRRYDTLPIMPTDFAYLGRIIIQQGPSGWPSKYWESLLSSRPSANKMQLRITNLDILDLPP
ncbi:hypothetical protein CEP52_005639 [Fusarium oligoseptatum]|uniref:Uncharacterized protein n=1 Tax=Fusarium oligoseptatum TaxID=2604345 RepID=A0A428TWZ5_9HYPO|nr:hypothetical protein CEP52_005639 [Fusarium oligoseptatum]